MTFHTASDSFVFWHNTMSNQNAVIKPGMAFDASYLTEVQSLVWQPIMLLKNVYLLPVGKQLKAVKIGMAVQADAIIIGY